MPTLDQVNTLEQSAFVHLLGGVFEHSPWVAQRAFARRPFPSREALHTAMVDVVKCASIEEQLALLNAHPELAGKEASAGTLTADSSVEQAAAGLNSLSTAELALLARLNRDYRTKFGFPFIIAVRDYDRRGIFAEFARRLSQDRESEFSTCLGQVYRITAIRLANIIA
jgi:2-oxo-4-hydroxy-4-carboxy-5-ureidoimidazoline decarboxylase